MSRIERRWRKAGIAALATATLATSAAAGGLVYFWEICHDPANEDPVATGTAVTDWDILSNGIISTCIGLGGSYSYGPIPLCGAPFVPITHQVAGAIAFLSLQGSAMTFDDNIVTMTDAFSLNTNLNNPPSPAAVPIVPSNRCGYVTIRTINPADNTATNAKWGANGFSVVVVPNASYRRMTLESVEEGGVRCNLVVNDIGTALRFQYTLTNLNAEARRIGLRFCNDFMMRSGGEDFLGITGRPPFMSLPTGRAPLVQQVWNRANTPNFAQEVNLFWSQWIPYPSVRVITDRDFRHPDQTKSDRFAIGGVAAPWTLDSLWDFPTLPDSEHDGQFAMWFDPVLVNAGASRTVIFYIEPAWARSDVAPPYTVATETDTLQEFDTAGMNSLTNNPSQIVAYIDNQFARIGNGIPINCDVTLNLPEGLTLADGEVETKNTGRIDANQLSQVRWTVISDGLHPGPAKYSIKVVPYTMNGAPLGNNMDFDPADPRPLPGNRRYMLQNSLMVSLTDKIHPKSGHNLVCFPWAFDDPDFDAIGVGGATVRNWNAATQSFEAGTEAIRGRGQWLSYGADPGVLSLNGANLAGDENVGEFDITLSRGWNLIGNPYPYPIVLNQINGRTPGDPDVAAWSDLVGRNLVKATLFSWDAEAGTYKFDSDNRQILIPGVGYWVYSPSISPVTLFYPPVFTPGLTGGIFRPSQAATTSDWRLPLAVSGRGEVDSAASIGVGNPSDVELQSAPKPPASPYSTVELSLTRNGTKMARDLRTPGGTVTFSAQVSGVPNTNYTITWPGISSIPVGVQFRISDLKLGIARNMRGASSYTFRMDSSGVRKFLITTSTR
jgi:hypothetical protein